MFDVAAKLETILNDVENWTETDPSLGDNDETYDPSLIYFRFDEYDPRCPSIQVVLENLPEKKTWISNIFYRIEQKCKITIFLKPICYDETTIAANKTTFLKIKNQIDKIFANAQFTVDDIATLQMNQGWDDEDSITVGRDSTFKSTMEPIVFKSIQIVTATFYSSHFLLNEGGWYGPIAGYDYEICSINFWTTTNRSDWNFKYWCDEHGFRVKHYTWASCPPISTAFLSQYPIVILGRASDKTEIFTDSELVALKRYALYQGSLFIFADVDWTYDNCVKINQVAALFGCKFGPTVNHDSIYPATGQEDHQLWNDPVILSSYLISWDALPETVDTDVATIIGWHGPSHLPALVIGKTYAFGRTERVVLTGYDSVTVYDDAMRNVINFFEGNFNVYDKSCWFIDASSVLGYATQVDMDLAWIADDDWSKYISLYDLWTTQRIGGHEVYDFGSVRNSTYYVRWKAILTAHASYSGHVDCEIYAGNKLVNMTWLITHHLDASAGGSANFGIETQPFTGSYRYVMVCFKSTDTKMCIDPTKLWVNGVWRN